MDSWNGLDFLIFLIFAVNTLLGMSRGSAKEIISMMSLCVALVCTIKFTIPLAIFFNKSPLMVDVITNKYMQNFIAAIGMNPLSMETLQQIAYCISMLICFVGTFSVCEGVLNMSGLLEVYSFPYAWLNRKLGAVLGGIRGYVITLFLISVVVLHLFKNVDTPMFQGSYFVNMFGTAALRLDSIISGQKPERYQDIFKDKNLYNPLQALQQLAQPGLEGTVPSNMTGPGPITPQDNVSPTTDPSFNNVAPANPQ